MPSQEDLARVGAGLATWNSWAAAEIASNRSPAVDLSGVTFPDISFAKCIFPGEVNFSGSTFQSRVSFGEADFRGPAIFTAASFQKEANFEKAKFWSNFLCNRVRFGRRAIFKDIQVAAHSSFQQSTFAGAVRFDGASFESVTSCMRFCPITGVAFYDQQLCYLP